MRRSTVVGLGLAALVLGSCATGGAPPPVAGGVRLERQAEAQAAAFERFMRDAGALDGRFSGPADVARVREAAAAYAPQDLESGMIAYAAAAALQEPGFVAGVRKAAGRGDLSRRLAADPSAALDLPGGPAAAGRASAALSRQGAPVTRAGAAVKQASYSVQRQAWAKATVPDARGRLARVKAAGGRAPGAADPARLYSTVAQAGGGRATRSSASPAVARGVAVAALTVLGEGGRARTLLREPRSGMCLRMAKLNFHQCLASAGPYYEDIYCVGLHALADTGRCVEAAARPSGRRASLD